MRILLSTSRIFIAGIILVSLTSCSIIPGNSPKVPPGFEILKGPANDTDGCASEIRHIATGIEMIYVAPGEFMMGPLKLEEGGYNDGIRHKVRLTKPYYIGKYEVTQEQWEKVMGNRPRLSRLATWSPAQPPYSPATAGMESPRHGADSPSTE